MYKIPKNLLEEVIQVIALATHPNKTYMQINQLISKLNQLENIEEKKEEK
jgi:hypothetical protein